MASHDCNQTLQNSGTQYFQNKLSQPAHFFIMCGQRHIFSDGSKEILSFEKNGLAQRFPITSRTVTSLTPGKLVKAKDDAEYAALTQIEAWGTVSPV